MKRGEIYLVYKPNGDPKEHRAFVVVSRQVLIESRLQRQFARPFSVTVRAYPRKWKLAPVKA